MMIPQLFTEARLNIEATSHESVLHIHAGKTAVSNELRSQPQKSSIGYQDEHDFAKHHLASESSIFFRQSRRSPRNILWRVLDERRAVHIESVDLLQDSRNRTDSLLSFVVTFADPIRLGGLAFVDGQDRDAVHCFALTTSNQLISVTLRKELLNARIPLSADFDASGCIDQFGLSSFSFRHPYKLFALTPTDLLISLHDGGLLRLEKHTDTARSTWRETFFSEGGWGSSLRSLLPWKAQNTVRYGQIDCQAASIIAVEPSPDRQHVYTVALDHTIKAWNTQSGRVGLQMDLLGRPQLDATAPPAISIDPHHGSLLKVYSIPKQPDGDLYYLVTASPKNRQFKFWGIRDADSSDYGIRDLHSESSFTPPIDEVMQTQAWQLADFEMKVGQAGRDSKLWIRARSGAVSRCFMLTFDLFALKEDVDHCWLHQWVAVEEGALSVDHMIAESFMPATPAALDGSFSPSSISDHWLEFLLMPGRFTLITIETALAIYQRSNHSLSPTIIKQAPLQQRLCAAIQSRASNATSNAASSGTRLATPWNALFGLIRHLHQRRSDQLALSLDLDTGLAWAVHADHVAPVRACSEIELYHLNEVIFTTQDDGWIYNSLPLADSLPHEDSANVARLLSAARHFRASLGRAVNQLLDDRASTAAINYVSGSSVATTASNTKSLQKLYDGCDFAAQVTDDDYARLTETTQDVGGLGGLEDDLFNSALNSMVTKVAGQARNKALTRYGVSATIAGSQDALCLGRSILLDLLALITFMSQDLEADELAPGFNAASLYASLITRLKEYNVLLWLASHVSSEPNESKGARSDASLHSSVTAHCSTLFESIFIGDWQELTLPEEPWPSLITYWARAWTFGLNISSAYEGVTAHVMGYLLKHHEVQLASDFAKFLTLSPWTSYLTGRMYLLQGEVSCASQLFKSSSDALSLKTCAKMESLDTAGLLSTVQRDGFRDGLPRFYMHIETLCESLKLWSAAADFAKLALSALEATGAEDLDSSIVDVDNRKRGSISSPATARMDLAMEEISLLRISELRDEIVSRLFASALQTARYELAFEALVKLRDPAL